MPETKMVTLQIDGQTLSVPEGELVVDAAKRIGNDIPVFCYHPKMEPVGMCRMCLVSIGRPMMDRTTGQPVTNEDGTPKITFSPKLETACTTPVSEGMVVVTNSQAVLAARKDVLEFLLTSHPLDCPICDKGGECPLQNLTLAHGPGVSRFLLDEKIHLAKHVPLGELIFLDRERCIQCARCIRFQDKIAGDPVIGFSQRGRALEIITFSEPGFDSYFSGNTTDICPVGALTTADFRFNARPWELKTAASVCNHCPVGCNLSLNVRREAQAGGAVTVKRIMPRQNEEVNEIWICDKGRFVYHYAESNQRITTPLVRRNGELQAATWEEATRVAGEKLRAAGTGMLTLAGGRLSNEDLFNLAQLTKAVGGRAFANSRMAGGDLVSRLAPPAGSNIKELGAGSVIIVAACDLEEEAPVWYLRVRAAVMRGAKLIVINPRATKLDNTAELVFRYEYGQAGTALAKLLPGGVAAEDETVTAAVELINAAGNLLVIYGSEGLNTDELQAVSAACASLLVSSGKAGSLNSGLLAAWEKGNLQGAWELGFQPAGDLSAALAGAQVVYAAAADPLGDNPALRLADGAFLIVQELFLTPTAQQADVVLPAMSFVEREGSYTSGERQVQRFYPAVQPRQGTLADFAITAQVARAAGVELENRAASLVFQRMADSVAAYAGLSYTRLAEVREQWPQIGREDLYYGGTGYDNKQGMGARLNTIGAGEPVAAPVPARGAAAAVAGSLAAYPTRKLYARSLLMQFTPLLQSRWVEPVALLHPDTAANLNLQAGSPIELNLNGVQHNLQVVLDESVPVGVALLPQGVAALVSEATPAPQQP